MKYILSIRYLQRFIEVSNEPGSGTDDTGAPQIITLQLKRVSQSEAITVAKAVHNDQVAEVVLIYESDNGVRAPIFDRRSENLKRYFDASMYPPGDKSGPEKKSKKKKPRSR